MTLVERVTPWDPAAKHRFVTRDGTALYVRESGAGPVTVLLVHGWTLDHTSWDAVVPRLSGVRIVRYDHRGHGGSAPAPAGTATLAQAADDLAELIADRVPGPIVLVGHSMGGMAAMALAGRHPGLFADRMVAACFVATSSGGLSELTLGLPKWLASGVRAVERRTNARIATSRRSTLVARPRTAAPGLRWLLFGRGASKADVLATATQVGRCHPASMAGFRMSLNDHDCCAVLAAFRDLPVTVLVGSADRLTDVSHARAIAAELPRARLVVYPKAGHMLPYERAADVAGHVSALLTRV